MRKLVLCLMLSAAYLANACVVIGSSLVKETFEHSYSLRAGGELDLENVNGGVTITAWDRDEVQVQAEKSVRAASDDRARELMKQLTIEVSASPDRVKIQTRMPHGNGLGSLLSGDHVHYSVEYRLQVPRRLALGVSTVNGGVDLTGTSGKLRISTTNGSVEVQQAQGDIALETTNGRIRLARVGGAVKAETTNGGIDAQLDKLDGNLSFESTNGGVNVKLPRDVRASIDLSTTNGHVESGLPVTGGTKSKRHLSGNINGGGGKVVVVTTNGGVDLTASSGS